MILFGLLIWFFFFFFFFFVTETIVNISLLKLLGCYQGKLISRGFTNKARQSSYRGEFNVG